MALVYASEISQWKKSSLSSESEELGTRENATLWMRKISIPLIPAVPYGTLRLRAVQSRPIGQFEATSAATNWELLVEMKPLNFQFAL